GWRKHIEAATQRREPAPRARRGRRRRGLWGRGIGRLGHWCPREARILRAQRGAGNGAAAAAPAACSATERVAASEASQATKPPAIATGCSHTAVPSRRAPPASSATLL